ncbi:hypothetical protein [Stenotrophomonas rhizophila]|uniref:hypothetical protein n=1 Tax=Stenotrophomonas rhizophila TaxID=216778 RepID=UPI001E4D6ADE|nr:hypothetical protein [Stenotrophomonas rhizophila]MCC7633356.1 hypothetical protein [Stenotrophomonas rhizophila]MCC7662247.1 hypothetical protein [Stenotrophomonas rhizophila]
MRLTLLLPLLLALAGCASTPPAPSPGTELSDTTVPAAEAAAQAAAEAAAEAAAAATCAAEGGTLQALGRLQREQCVVRYADAGKACRAKSDCTGQCLATAETAVGAKASGVCQSDVSQNFGCRQRIDKGVAQGTICVD